jgi:hypothetical protein
MSTDTVYQFEKETRNTVRYSRPNGRGGVDVQYVPKSVLPTPYPKQITVTVSWDEQS